MSLHLDAALAAAAFGVVAGAFLPQAIRPLAEPEDDPEEAEAFGETEPKELYSHIASLPWLPYAGAISAAVVCLLLGLRLDFSWELLALAAFVPAGVALFVIDTRTRYLPTWLIGPFYPWMVVVGVAAAIERGTWTPILGELAGWLVYGGFFVLIWLLVPAGGLGYGDVRLAGLLGLGLGLVSWGAFAVGMFAGIALGGLTAAAMLVIRRRKHYPYGPYLLIGAVIGAVYGKAFADWYLP